MSPTDELDAAIAAHPAATTVPGWRTDDVATVTRDLIAAHGGFVATTGAEVAALMALIAVSGEEYGTQRIKVGGVEVKVGGREIHAGKECYQSSGRIPGLFRRGDMPKDKGVHARALVHINETLRTMGREASALDTREPEDNHKSDFQTTIITIATPERSGETYELHGHFAHRGEVEFDRSAQDIARLIAARSDHRAEVEAMRRGIEEDIGARIAKVDSMRVVGSGFQIDTWRTLRKGEFAGTANADVEMLGPRLTPQTVRIGRSDEYRQLKRVTTLHRAHQRQRGDKEADEALQCDPILANAILGLDPRYAADLLAEMESLLRGRGRNPTNPRLRRIANLSVHRGIIRAPVTLGAKIRHHRDHIQAKPIRAVPETMLTAMPGRPMREVLDHPWLEGLTILRASVNSYGLRLRPAETGVPLAPALDALRRKVAEHEAAPVVAKRRSR